MRVHVGGDHAAYDLHQALVAHLTAAGHDVTDHGPHHLDPEDDYPVAVLRAAAAVAADPESLGVVLGGSGNGEQIAANKVPGVRARAGVDGRARDAGPRAQRRPRGLDRRSLHGGGGGVAIVDAFLATPFSGVERHARRLAMIAAFESDGTLPPQP